MDQYGNPYGARQGHYRQSSPPRRSSTLIWVLLILGGGGAAVVLACCGICGGLAYVGFEEDETYLQAMFQENEVVQDKIGNIQSLERDWGKSFADEDDEIWYFRVEGDKGSGEIIIRDSGFSDVDLEWARLNLDSGEEFEIYP